MNARTQYSPLLLGALVLIAVSQMCPAQQSTYGKRLATIQTASAREKPHRVAILIAQWTRARDWTLEYVAKMPEEHLGFKPVPEVRSFAEQMLHLAYWNFGFTAGSFGRTSPYKEEELMRGEFKTKARLSKVVGESYDFVINGLKGLSDAQLDEQMTLSNGAKALRIERINDAYEHQTHHRGQTVVYLRLKGLEPPTEPF